MEEIIPNIKRVAAYGGLSINEALDLPCDMFQAFLRASVVEDLQQTDEGREYLEKCERMKITEPDMSSLNEFMRGDNNVIKSGTC